LISIVAAEFFNGIATSQKVLRRWLTALVKGSRTPSATWPE
jgi:hypothetical protein